MFDLGFSNADRLLREIEDPKRAEWLLRLRDEWLVQEHYWFPLTIPTDGKCPPHTEAFDYLSFEQELTYETLRQILATRQISTVFELREDDSMAEIELNQFHPVYKGLEGFWFTSQFDWLIYASHEDSITVAGEWLLPAVKAAWPNWEQCLWTMPTYG